MTLPRFPMAPPEPGDRFHMVWTEGVCTGKISRQKFVDVIATLPAKINGIYPRKGTLAVGSDADIVIFDPSYEGQIHLADNPNGVDYNIYEGRRQSGRVETVLLRGSVVVGKRQICGSLRPGAVYSRQDVRFLL